MKIISILLLVLLAGTAVCQQKVKPKEKAPTKKEMEEAMKEAQAMMNEMSPEDKKMMDSMGIKIPDIKKMKMPAVSDKELADAWEDEQRIVPKKDHARIASIPVIANGRLLAYVTATHQKLSAKLDPKIITVGNKVYNYIQGIAKTKQQAGNMALGFWMSGQPELCLYLLGKICSEDISQTDNLSNYTSALIMLGGEQLAIPVLQILNTKFRNNSTILNNLGQAWFGLGDIAKADKYLDSAIAIYPYHPQANFTKASIEESRGNKTKAVKHVRRSIRHSYTKAKEDKLNQLGHKLVRKDLRIPFSAGSDPMGLEQTRRPDYPTSIAGINAWLPAWKEFNSKCDQKIRSIQVQWEDESAKYTRAAGKIASNAINMINNGGLPMFSAHPFARKASMELRERMSYYEQRMKKEVENYTVLQKDLDELRKKYLHAAPEAPCSEHRDRINKLLEAINSRKKIYDEQALRLFKQYCNDMVYWSQYTSTDKNSFKMIQLEFQLFWLKKNRELQPLDMDTYYGAYNDCQEKEESKPGRLSEFDDIACNYRTVVDLILVKYDMNCSHTTITYTGEFQTLVEKQIGNKYVGGTLKTHASMKTEGKWGPLSIEGSVGFNVEQHFDENRNMVDWNGTVEAGVEVSAGIDEGPAKLEGKLGEEIEIEFGTKGIEDINVTHSAEATVGLYRESVTIGTKERVSLISGTSFRTYTGSLKGIVLNGFK